MLAVVGGAVGLLAAATGLTPTLLFIVVSAVAALRVAWLAYLGKNPAKALLTDLYSAAGVTGVLGTVPFQQYQELSLIAVGLVGSGFYTRIGMPVSGNKHVFILLCAGLLLHHRVLNRPTGEFEPPLWLGFAIGGVAAMGLEAFIA